MGKLGLGPRGGAELREGLKTLPYDGAGGEPLCGLSVFNDGIWRSEARRHKCSNRRAFVLGWLARVVGAWHNLWDAFARRGNLICCAVRRMPFLGDIV
jgi:hypothetical protein